MRTDHSDLMQRFHGHLEDAWRRLSLSVADGWVADVGGLTCMATGSTSPSFNLAITGARMRDPHAALDAAVDRYQQAALPWLLKLRPDVDRALVADARGRGIDFDEEPVYGLTTRSVPGHGPPPNAALEVVTADRNTIADAVSCFADAFEAEPEVVQRELGPNLLTIPSFTVFIGYLAGEPVATSMLATTPEVQLAGVYSVATRQAHRGRGFGTAMTWAAVLAARAQGYDTVVLEPSPIGAPMYRRMGFEPIGSYLEGVV
jgi:ribosomal protein S18 acetylase RimI-like enzyme